MAVTVTVQYMGVVRLLLGSKEDIFEFEESPDFKMILASIEERHGKDIRNECLKQAFFLQAPSCSISRQIKFPDDQEITLSNGSIIRIVSVITGG